MWTVIWLEDEMDKWDIFETKEQVMKLMKELKEMYIVQGL